MTKHPSQGFIEVLILLAGIAGFAAYGVIHNNPAFKAIEFSSAMTKKMIPSPTPDPIRFDRAIGIELTHNYQVEVLLNGERTLVPLLGTEEPASSSADCILKPVIDGITRRIEGKSLYMVYYENTPRLHNMHARYIFLEDGASLNSFLIAQGVVKASSSPHPYFNDFNEAEQHARENKTGLWSSACEVSITPSPAIPAKLKDVENTITPSHTVTPTPTPRITSVIVQEIYNTPKPTPTPVIVKASPTSVPPVNLTLYLDSTSSARIMTPAVSLNADLIFQLINSYRLEKHLVPFEKDSQLCALAGSRAPELYNEIFVTGKVHEGFYSRNVPYWITENMASYPTEQQIVNWWLTSPIHRSAIEGNYKYSCGACSGTSCTQLFTSYVGK